ncbi:MAG: GIY-YIG nuclease family protein [Gammaproteobacteria bacterium]
MSDWYVYILHCADGTFYTGTTTDVQRRVYEHNHNKQAAAYTRARRPVDVIHVERLADRSAAYRREAEIKALSRQQKQQLAAGVRRGKL